MSKGIDRRSFLKKSALVSSAVGIGLSLEEQALLAGAAETSKSPAAASGSGLPTGKIGKLKISRLICGGNLISGFAHSRDLIYVSSLLKNYFTDEKILDTLQLAEERGINTAILRCDDQVIDLLDKYWKERGGKMQWIAQTYVEEEDVTGNIKKAIDGGCVAAYIHGGIGDTLVEKGKVDLLGKAVEFIKQNGLPAGVAGHLLKVPMAVEKAGIDVDFYMKTFNSKKYWSAGPKLKNDGIGSTWDEQPEKTIEYMKSWKKPWIAYKILAAGAIHPRDGFEYAFKNGADFICVGMFDFQITEDVVIAKNALKKTGDRSRPWMA